MAHKYCELNGTWFRHPESNQIWSNYTTCVNLQDLSVSYFLMYLPPFVYKLNWLLKFSLISSKRCNIWEHYNNRVKEIANCDLWRYLMVKTIWREKERGFIPLGNNIQVLTRESQLHSLSLVARYRRSDTDLISRYFVWRFTISQYILQELISFERTGRVCWNIWKTRTLHPTERVLLILHRNVV